MPAKATLFDLKCEAKFDFGTGPRNSAFYNPFGNNILSEIYLQLFYNLLLNGCVFFVYRKNVLQATPL